MKSGVESDTRGVETTTDGRKSGQRGLKMNIGDRLRKIRTEHNLTAKKLSELSGVPEKTIYRIETGEVQDPKISSIEPLVKAMNCSADELLFNREDYPKAGALRQLFANISNMDEPHQELIIDSLRIMVLGCSYEELVSKSMREAELFSKGLSDHP